MIDLPPDRWQRVDQVFAAVLDLPEGERDDWLRETCAGDDDLYRTVRTLLDSDAEAERVLGDDVGSFLAPLGNELEAALREQGPPLPGGGRVGAWELLEEVGRGGMATVYLAEREQDGVRQRVALKLIRRGIDTDDVLGRFRAERRILAALEHPNIARFLEAGSTDDGRPYLVMEAIRGRPITEHCDAVGLSLDDRLRLVRTVGSAVQHAHRQLVVHRDIKPSNVLVTDEGVVKLLDFGIAKLVGGGDEAADVRTRTGARVLTPEYAAPEQIRGDIVTTATDVHGLGLLLYELLSGRRPFDLSGLSRSEAERVLLEHEPPPPSARVPLSGPDADEIAAARATTPERLRRRLRGDLDRIVLRALARDPADRYASVEQLVSDLDAWRRGMPVSARVANRWYVASRFVRRHWRGVAVAASLVLLFGAFSVATTVQQARTERARQTAERERETAERIASFVESLFSAADPFAPTPERPDTLRLASLLERGAERARAELGEEPLVQAGILRVIGGAFRSARQHDRAAPILDDALALLRATPAAPPERLSDVLNELGNLELGRARPADAERWHREALDLRRAALGEDHPETMASMANLASALQDQGRLDEADTLYASVLARQPATTATDSARRADLLNARAVLATRARTYDIAAAHASEALAINRSLLGPAHPRVGRELNNLAVIQQRAGRLGQASGVLRESIAINRAALGEGHVLVGLQLGTLAGLLVRMDSVDAAGPLFAAALDRLRPQVSPGDPNLHGLMGDYAAYLHRRGDLAGAEAAYREALSGESALGASHPIVVRATGGLGTLLCERGSRAEGIRWLERAAVDRQGDRPGDGADLDRIRASLEMCGGGGSGSFKEVTGGR